MDISIHPASMLALIFLLHFVADFTLQGCLANLKQEKWWAEQIPKEMQERKRIKLWRKYQYDYLCGLVCHGFYWSLVVSIPLLLAGGFWYAINAFAHGVLHVCIDDAKANRMKLNLWQDQALHALQVMLIWFSWIFVR